MNNLHISLTEFRNESRVIKETASLQRSDLFNQVYVAALHTDDLRLNEQLVSGVNARRFALNSRKLGANPLAHAAKYLEYGLRLFSAYRRQAIGVVNVHCLALLPMGWILAKVWAAKLVYDAHELETETTGLQGRAQLLLKKLEKWMIERCDLIIVVSESIADWYRDEYTIARPTVVLNAPKLFSVAHHDRFRTHFDIPAESTILLYQGLLAPSRGVELLLEAFEQRSDQSYVLVFMGYGPLEHEVREAARRCSIVYYHPAVPPDELLTYTSSADVGASLIEAVCLSNYFCMPNKIFEYMMAGLPVLVSNTKDMAALVRAEQTGIVVEAMSADAVNAALDELSATEFDTLSENAKETAMKHAWEVQERNMLAAYQQAGVGSTTC